MKKILSVSLIIVLIFSLCSCTTEDKEKDSSENMSQDVSATADGTAEKAEITTVSSLARQEVDPAKVYVVYFSHSTDPVDSVASYIADKTGGTLHVVETNAVYPENEKELLQQAEEEYKNGVRPSLKNSPSDMFEYDIVFLCFPAWCSTMPMALWTFTEDYDMRDKAVLPVCYGSNTELNNAIRDINALKPNMTVVSGFSFETDLISVAEDLDAWLQTALYGE